jgi:hypothetical protein
MHAIKSRGCLQAARDALAALHGEPEVASHLQHSIMDSLVCLLRNLPADSVTPEGRE